MESNGRVLVQAGWDLGGESKGDRPTSALPHQTTTHLAKAASFFGDMLQNPHGGMLCL
jgi:hypothetical protein